MPSPIAHALAGAVVGWVVDPAPRVKSGRLALFAVMGMAADLDLLVGAHSGPTHGLGAAAIAGIVVGVMGWGARWRIHSRTVCAVTLAYASHTLLDWLGTDSSPPIGIMALWPFGRDYYESSWHVFMAISRRYWLPEFWTFNVRALGRELMILVPLALIVVIARRRPPAPTGA
jgi:membrane-bound metal-dependent hydrolase YbcI (DUF457 family)